MKHNPLNISNRLALIVMFFSSIALLEERFLITDILASFKFQYFWFFSILMLINIFYKKIHYMALFLAMSLINLYSLYPTWSFNQKLINSDFTIYFANIHESNRNYHLVKESIAKENPDIIILQEVNHEWARNLVSLENEYRYKILLPKEDNFGIAVYSKYEFLDQKILKGRLGLDSILFKVEVKNKIINILTSHPPPPIGSHLWNLRNNQYLEIAEHINNVEGEKIIIGDLNVVPWSSHLKKLSQNTKLRLTHSIFDTWNTHFPLGMRIKLDHALISSNLIESLRVLDGIGSDHLPLKLNLGFKKHHEGSSARNL